MQGGWPVPGFGSAAGLSPHHGGAQEGQDTLREANKGRAKHLAVGHPGKDSTGTPIEQREVLMMDSGSS